MKYYLCMEIGGTNLRYGAVSEDFQLLSFSKIKTEALSDAVRKDDYINGLLQPLVKKYGSENIRCLSLSIASLMDEKRSMCYSSPNIKGFDNLPLADILRKKTGMPVFMERDVNTSLLYDIWKKGYDKSGIIIGIYIGTGLGNAMCIDGRIYRGSTGSSCELGHIPLYGLTEKCGCGKAGCIEIKASGKALEKLAAEKFNCPVKEIFKLHRSSEEAKNTVNMCAIAAAAEITILDPKHVILGGGVVEMEGFPLEEFINAVRVNLRVPNPRNAFRIELSSFDAHAGIVGAAINAAGIMGPLH